MAFVKISLFACLLAAVNAQYTAVSPTPAYYAPHVAVPTVPLAPVAHVAHVPVAHVAPAPYARIISQTHDTAPDGSYSFSYQTEDGSARSESGTPRFAPQPGVESFGGLAVQGSYSYASPEGPVDVQYTADENGYQPSGSGVHPAIVKAVEEQVALAKSEGPIPPTAYARPVVHVAPVAHVAVPHYPVAHVAVPHYPVAVPHYPVAAVPHYPVAAVPHIPVSAVSHVPFAVSPTPTAVYGTTVAKK